MIVPKYPDGIQRDGAYKVYKGVRYTVYDDGNSANTAYNADLAAYWEAVARLAVETIRHEYRGTTHWEGCEDTHWPCRLLKEICPLPDKESP
jgi:hypothetical protein